MLRILVQTVPAESQRYPTVGDWLFDEDSNTLTIMVNDVGDWKKEFLVAIHEMVEAVLCSYQGISQTAVDEFDLNFEKNRMDGDTSEPGDDSDCPYYHPHQVATAVERLMAAELDVNWKEYEESMQ